MSSTRPLRFTKRRIGGNAPTVTAVLMAVVGIMAIVMGAPFMAVFTLPFALLAATGREEVEVDFGSLRYRSYFSFMWIRWGRYKPLPKLEHVLVRDYRERIIDQQSGKTSDVLEKYELSLFARDEGKLVLCISESATRMQRHLKAIGAVSALPVIDRTKEKIMSR